MNSPQLHFIISAPRSGSTWLASALNQHPDIFATEQRLFGNFCELWPNNNGNLAPRLTFDAYARAFSVHYSHEQQAESRTDFIEEFISEYAKFLIEFAHRKTGKKIIVDKVTPYPGTTGFVVEQIGKHFPKAKIFQLIRDGRDVVTSGTFDWLLKDSEGSDRHAYFVKQESNVRLLRFFDDDVLKKWATNWKETVRIFNTHPPVAKFRFEDMLQDQSVALKTILEILDIDSSTDVLTRCAAAVTFEKAAGRPAGQLVPTAKQRLGISGDWRNYFTKQDGELFDAIAGADLINENYEPDSSWFKKLPEQLSFGRDRSTDRTLLS